MHLPCIPSIKTEVASIPLALDERYGCITTSRTQKW